MNDFFSVLDEFDFEEFEAPAEASGDAVSFSMDTAYDSSPGPDVVPDYSEQKLDDVKTDADDVKEDDVTNGTNYVWQNGTDPFSRSTSTAGIYLSFSTVIDRTTGGGEDGTLPYKEVKLSFVSGLSFTQNVTTGDGLVIDRTNIGVQATAGVNISMSNGKLTGGSFSVGVGRLTVGIAGGDLTDTTTLAIEGFEEDAVSYELDNEDLKSVTTDGDTDGVVTVTGDYNFLYNGEQVKITGAADDQAYSMRYDDDGNLVLDLNEVEAAEGSTLRVVSAGGAEAIIPPTAADGEIKIGSTTYEYASGGNAEFLVSGTTVKGFVLADAQDAISIAKGATISVYDADDTTSAIATLSGVTVTKLANDYVVTVDQTGSVTIGETTFDFNISKATQNAGAVINIYFNEEGEIKGVAGLDDFTNSNDKMVVSGANVSEEEGGIPILTEASATGNITKANIEGYISVSDGDFTYAGAANGEDTVTVAADTTVYSVNGTKLLYLSSDGTVTDGVEAEYTTTGKGFFNMEGDEIVSYNFVAVGDSIEVPTEDGIPVLYNGTAITIPDIVDSDDEITVKMTKAGEFVASGLEAGAVVDERYTFTSAGGSVKFEADGDILGIYGFVGNVDLYQADSGLVINGDELTYTFGDNTTVITATGDGTKLASVTGLNDLDTIAAVEEGTTTASGTVFDFFTDSSDGDTTDLFTVNGKDFTVVGDNNNISISAGGDVDGLDQDAILQASEGPITVNDVPYSADEIKTANATNEAIIGYQPKDEDKDVSSFVTDYNHPIFNPRTSDDDLQGARWLNTTYDNTYRETTVDDVSELNRSSDADTINSRIYLDGVDPDATVTAAFNNGGNNLAIVTEDARGTKNIVLGDRGDAVIMMGRDEYSEVNIVGGAGNDTIFVGGRSGVNDAVVHDVGMLTTIDLSKGGVDKVHTYAAANAKIVLNNYDETSLGGVVVHDPEIPYIKSLTEAIRDGLIAVDGDAIVAIDRDETATGVDRKTRITVNNLNSAHQSMIRLFGYKDNKDEYGDDYGQLLGFTGTAGGVLDASDLTEDVVLIGNKDNTKTGSSALTGTAYDDTIFAGASDIVNAGAGTNLIVLDDTITRDAAYVVVGEGHNIIENLQSDFDGDVLDVTAISGRAELAFEDGVLSITDPTTKTITTATDPWKTDDEFIEVNLLDNGDTLKAAVAKEGGTILVGDDEPNYYVAKGGAISFENYTDNVVIDVQGDYETSFVGDTNVTLGSSVNSLYGGNGLTYFKGGAADETLVAGIGESSLYGGGGKNVLVGSTGNDKVGSTEFFVIGINNGAQNTISNFEFIADDATNQATFDNLNLGMADGNEVTDIQVSGNDVIVAVKGAESGATEKVTIEGAAGKEMLVDRGQQTETVAQIAATEVTVNNSYVDFYAATDDALGATVKVGNVDSTEIWLGGPPIDHDKAVPEFTSSKFTVIDASSSAAEVLMAGNELANTIIGGYGTASMWGGYGNANDVMIAGSGHNEFYYEMGNGNDTILGTNEGDIVHLGATLDQIDFDGTYMEGSSIVVKFTDGGQLNIENSTNDVTFSFDDGTAIKANRQSGQFE